MMAKPLIDFSELRDSEVDQRAENILVKTGADARFTNPVPALSVLQESLDAYRASLVDSALRNKKTVIIKNRKRTELEQIMRELALYVAQVAKGDPEIILAAGYDHNKAPRPGGPCPKPTDFRAELQREGSGRVKLRVKAEKLARMYRFEYRRRDHDDHWTEILSTSSRAMAEGLEALNLYDFRVVYLGTDPTLTYSDVISTYVL